jgi:TRAP-type C4-dicarboxylate transport system permease large subunit
MRSIAPFYGALALCLLLVTYVSGFSLWLPGMFSGK